MSNNDPDGQSAVGVAAGALFVCAGILAGWTGYKYSDSWARDQAKEACVTKHPDPINAPELKQCQETADNNGLFDNLWAIYGN